MKKRLLSAALALALVLTMLPLAAMPAFAATTATQLDQNSCSPGSTESTAVKTVSVTYRAAGYQFQAANNTTGAEAITAPEAGWYYWGNALSKADPKVNELYQAKDGVIIGTGTSGNWYYSANDALEYGKANSIKLINDQGVDLSKAQNNSLSIDINGNTATFSGELKQNQSDKDQNTKLTALTITNSGGRDENGDLKGGIAGSIKATDQAFNFTATNAPGSSAPTITLENTTNTARTLTVRLTDSKVGAITVTKGAADVKVTASTQAAAETGAITVNGTAPTDNYNYGNTTINVSGGKTGDITINGKGTITLSDMAEVGAITLSGGTKDTTNKLPNWGGAFTVTVGSQCKTGAITEGGDNGTDAVITVNANGGSGTKGGIDSIAFNKSATAHKVTISGAKVDKTIAMNAGTLTVSSGANVAGAVTLGKSGTAGTITATISGSATKVNSIDGSAASDITLNISGGTISATSDCIQLPEGYAKHTITGGSFGASIRDKAGWLKDVNYEIKGTTYYTYTKSFQDCVNAYKNDSTAEIVIVGAAKGEVSSLKKVSFYLDAPADDKDSAKPVVEIYTDENNGVTLPTSINNKSVTTWYNEGGTTSYTAGALVKITEKETKYYATVSSADNSEIVSVTADYSKKDSGTYNADLPGLSATLSGTTIRVSGALPATKSSGFVDIALLVKTALGNEYHISVAYSVTEKKLLPSDLSNSPFIAGKDNASIQVSGTTLLYALDGSGLVVSAGGVDTAGLKESDAATSVATVNVSGGNAEKNQLKAALEATKADFSGSAAVQEAANKVKAGLSQTQVDNYIRQAKIALWKQTNTGNPNESEISSMADWNTLKIVVYLNIQATGWDRTAGSQSLQLNITPYYRLDVTKADGSAPYTVKAGATLPMGGVTGEYGDVKVKLDSSLTDLVSGLDWAHHGNYVYKIDGGAFTTSHGFSPFLLNHVDPVAVVYKNPDDAKSGTVKAYYDSVQTAIDDTEDGNVVKLFTTYSKTAETYSFSGKARTITFDPGVNGTFTPTFSGASVTADKTNGNVWTVQLNSDTVVSTAHISLGSYTNGTASLSTTNAAQGSTVTVTTTPNTGYRSLTPTVTANTGSVSVTGSDGTYTFTVPNGATSITVTPAFVLGDVPFTDVSENAWYYAGVSYCYNTFAGSSRLMQGVGNDRFGVSSTMTRAQIVEIMWRMSGSPVEAPRVSFSDVNSGYWAYNSIAWAANHGIVEGYENGTFKPESAIKRQELAQMLWKFAGRPNVSVNLAASYPDGASVPLWAQSAMQWAAGRGILSGRSSVALSRLDADENAYRSELAVTIMKYHQYYG